MPLIGERQVGRGAELPARPGIGLAVDIAEAELVGLGDLRGRHLRRPHLADGVVGEVAGLAVQGELLAPIESEERDGLLGQIIDDQFLQLDFVGWESMLYSQARTSIAGLILWHSSATTRTPSHHCLIHCRKSVLRQL